MSLIIPVALVGSGKFTSPRERVAKADLRTYFQ